MDNNYYPKDNGVFLDLFNILGNENRRKIVRLLFDNEYSINGIAKEVGIAVPVALKHVRILEKNRIVERKKIGNMHVLRLNTAYLQTIKKIFHAIGDSHVIKAHEGETLLDAFKRVPGIGLKKTPSGYLVEKIDGKKGYFLFEINGKIPEKSIEKITLEKNSEISFYHLTPVLGKRFAIQL
ncbi:MAG: winged helix-turn-helix domain-containing protein [Candidatus Micrarchaeota archaeon]